MPKLFMKVTARVGFACWECLATGLGDPVLGNGGSLGSGTWWQWTSILQFHRTPVLICIGGLPATSKTTVARALSVELRAA
jgi:hypothetical protein